MNRKDHNKALPKKGKTTKLTEDELCSEHISVKATPYQKAEIIRKAEACGMRWSPYLVARGFNYSPKARLTDEEKELLRPLQDIRLDVINFTNALNAMSADERKAMFNRHKFMFEWLRRITDVAQQVKVYLDSVKRPNRRPPRTRDNTDKS